MSAPPAPPAFRITPLLLATLLSTMAMMAFVALIGPLVRRLSVPELVAGLAMAAGGVFWMLMAQWWGRQSDRRGRKPVLLLGLGVFALAYGALALFVDLALHRSLPVWLVALALIGARAVIGAFYGAVPPTCAALVADHTSVAARHLSMAKLSSAMALGMVLGPAIISAVSGYGLEWGFYANAALPLIAVACVLCGLPVQLASSGHANTSSAAAATLHPSNSATSSSTGAAHRLALFDRRLRMACFTSFSTILTLSVTQVCLGFFIMDRLHLAEAPAARVTGFALTGVGVAMMVAQQLVLRLHRVTVRQWIVGGAGIAALGFGAMAWVHAQTPLLIAFALGSLGVGMLFPTFQAMAANAVSASEQGRAAGAVSTFQGLGMALGPLLGTALYRFGPAVPYVGIALLLITLALTLARRR